jgi:putative membrane protein insertion efficiency factor
MNFSPAGLVRHGAHYAIRGYQLTLSSLIGRQCRHWPSCSTYTDEAIQRHGLWVGAWMGLARICRCGPGGTSGIDLVGEAVPEGAAWHIPWRYGRWRGVNSPLPQPLDEIRDLGQFAAVPTCSLSPRPAMPPSG